MTIKESLEHQGISDSLELSLKFSFHTMSSMSANYLQLGKKTGRIYKKGVFAYTLIFEYRKSILELVIMKMIENGSNS